MSKKELFNKIRTSLKRRSSKSSTSSTCSSVSESETLFHPLTTEPNMKRDFVEFLQATYCPDLIKYVDFVDSCHKLNFMDRSQLEAEISRIYSTHIRQFAPDKIFFDDMGALKLEIEIKLSKSERYPNFYSKAVSHCLYKIGDPFSIFLSEAA